MKGFHSHHLSTAPHSNLWSSTSSCPHRLLRDHPFVKKTLAMSFELQVESSVDSYTGGQFPSSRINSTTKPHLLEENFQSHNSEEDNSHEAEGEIHKHRSNFDLDECLQNTENLMGNSQLDAPSFSQNSFQLSRFSGDLENDVTSTSCNFVEGTTKHGLQTASYRWCGTKRARSNRQRNTCFTRNLLSARPTSDHGSLLRYGQIRKTNTFVSGSTKYSSSTNLWNPAPRYHYSVGEVASSSHFLDNRCTENISLEDGSAVEQVSRDGDSSKLDQLALVAVQLTGKRMRSQRTPRKYFGSQFTKFSKEEVAGSSTVEMNRYASLAATDSININKKRNASSTMVSSVVSPSCSSNYIDEEQLSLADNKSQSLKKKGRRPALSKKALRKFKKRREPGYETRVQLCAKHVLEFVGSGVHVEKIIRSALGNNPDTSKALRLLLSQHLLRRIGEGGRKDPYTYQATPLGLLQLGSTTK